MSSECVARCDQVRITSRAPDKSVYKDMCQSYTRAMYSQDALAFNVRLPHSLLSHLQFVPNRLGAENLLSCHIHRAGFLVWNVCRDLPIFHNPCSDVRTYSGSRIDGERDNSSCLGHSIAVRPLDQVLRLSQSMRANETLRAPRPHH